LRSITGYTAPRRSECPLRLGDPWGVLGVQRSLHFFLHFTQGFVLGFAKGKTFTTPWANEHQPFGPERNGLCSMEGTSESYSEQ